GTNVWTHQGGTGAMTGQCSADTPSQPGERHPTGQMAVDTKRNFLWLYGGPNSQCDAITVTVTGSTVTSASTLLFASSWPGQEVSIGGVSCGTIASVADKAHLTLSSSTFIQGATTLQLTSLANRNPRRDTYYMTLNADPKANTWHQVMPAHYPSALISASMTYD